MASDHERLREIPAVQSIVRALRTTSSVPSIWIYEAAQKVLAEIREGVQQGDAVPPEAEILARVRARAQDLATPHLRPVINATGVLIHTNLGRAPLPPAMMSHLEAIATQYSTLEYRLKEGVRGSRHEHVDSLLAELVGAEAAMVVNNNAAAVLLALSALAQGRQVIVSRGELVEIGGSFRIPEVMALSGARLTEVGATNKTHLYDYERAIGPETALLLKVHQSNFRQFGFVASVSRRELVQLGQKHQIPVMEDLGSGVLLPLTLEGYSEPTVQEVVRDGVELTTFSGDKLLGGPQAGLAVGRREWIERMKKHPLARAVRVDKMTLAVLELVLRWYREGRGEALPLWRMIRMPAEDVRRRAERVVGTLHAQCEGMDLDIVSDWSEIGGGSMPGTRVPTYVIQCAVPASTLGRWERSLREAPTPVIARVGRGRLMLDLRTVFDDQDALLTSTLAETWRAVRGIEGGKDSEDFGVSEAGAGYRDSHTPAAWGEAN
ncbi:MAG: L-seryl-tRNA(Sec) selenium transferase [Firmicutes bacterium]|nr:L-seryl-tRNA(Sec) selenium transferase [Bacillota bacterium]